MFVENLPSLFGGEGKNSLEERGAMK